LEALGERARHDAEALGERRTALELIFTRADEGFGSERYGNPAPLRYSRQGRQCRGRDWKNVQATADRGGAKVQHLRVG
jgi:hypothetical protein